VNWHLLAGIPPEETREVLKIARRRRFGRNEVVFHRDDPGDSLHLIQKGRFSVQVMTPLGDAATIAWHDAGDRRDAMRRLRAAILRLGHWSEIMNKDDQRPFQRSAANAVDELRQEPEPLQERLTNLDDEVEARRARTLRPGRR